MAHQIPDDGTLLPLMEEFYTIQGEGYHTGKAAYFIRLGGCDVGCHWCDVKESWDAELHALTHADKEKHTAAVEFLDNVLDQDLKRILLPLLESERVLECARAIFRVEPQSAEATLAGLLESDDRWLTVCAIAAAVSLPPCARRTSSAT